MIGNQSYPARVGVLRNPHNDITLVSHALERQGYQVLPLVKDATRVQILAGVRDLVRRLNSAGAGAVGFLYYSGHGAAEVETRRNYLIPIDAKGPGTDSFWDESVKLNNVLSLLSEASAAAKFVVFDACRNELRLIADRRGSSRCASSRAFSWLIRQRLGSLPWTMARQRSLRGGPCG